MFGPFNATRSYGGVFASRYCFACYELKKQLNQVGGGDSKGAALMTLMPMESNETPYSRSFFQMESACLQIAFGSDPGLYELQGNEMA